MTVELLVAAGTGCHPTARYASCLRPARSWPKRARFLPTIARRLRSAPRYFVTSAPLCGRAMHLEHCGRAGGHGLRHCRRRTPVRTERL